MWKAERTRERRVMSEAPRAQPSKYKKDRQIYEGLMSHRHKRKANTARCALFAFAHAEWVRRVHTDTRVHRVMNGAAKCQILLARSLRCRNKMRFWFYGGCRCEIDFSDARSWFLEDPVPSHFAVDFEGMKLHLGPWFLPGVRAIIFNMSYIMQIAFTALSKQVLEIYCKAACSHKL